MVDKEEFIWNKNHFVCHITEEKNMLSIIEKGLIPMNGDRCRFIMDNRTGVFCLEGLQNVQAWAESLYEEYELETLKLLRFNLKRRKWYFDTTNERALGMYLPCKVLPEKLSYLDIRDKDGIVLPITKLFDIDFLYNIDQSFSEYENDKQFFVDDCSLSWQPINQYEKILKINK